MHPAQTETATSCQDNLQFNGQTHFPTKKCKGGREKTQLDFINFYSPSSSSSETR